MDDVDYVGGLLQESQQLRAVRSLMPLSARGADQSDDPFGWPRRRLSLARRASDFGGSTMSVASQSARRATDDMAVSANAHGLYATADLGGYLPGRALRATGDVVRALPRAQRLSRARAEDGVQEENSRIRTLDEPCFSREPPGSGTHIDAETVAALEALPAASEELNARRPAAPVTVDADARAGMHHDSFVIPASVRATGERELGLRVSHAAEARRSHEVWEELEDERGMVLELLQHAAVDESLWAKKTQGGVNNPVVALLHNALVRVRRWHRLLDDAGAVSDADVDASIQMLDFCTMVVKRSGRSVLYNQAVKHMGEFFCFAHVTPAVLGVAAAERRASNGSALAVVRDALGALFGLLAKGSQLNESSRAAVRESLRCAACSAAPASVLVESAVECMLRSVKQRDDFALRAREMGLTVVYMCLRRHPWSAVRAYFDGPCRVTNLRSKLHALVSVLAMARADASKSALNKHLVGEVLLVLHAHVGERLAGVVRMAELDADTVDELLRGAGMRAEAEPGERSASAARTVERRSGARRGSPSAADRRYPSPGRRQRTSGERSAPRARGPASTVRHALRGDGPATDPAARRDNRPSSISAHPSVLGEESSGISGPSTSSSISALPRRPQSADRARGAGSGVPGVRPPTAVMVPQDGPSPLSVGSPHGVRSPPGSGRRRADSTSPHLHAGLLTLTEPDFATPPPGLPEGAWGAGSAGGVAAAPSTCIEAEAVAALEALPAASEELNARRPAAPVTVDADARAGMHHDSFVIPASVRATGERELGLRVSHAAEARRSHEVWEELEDERGMVLELLQHAAVDESLWAKKTQGGVNNPVVALLHNALVRVRRWHRLLDDAGAVSDADVDASFQMLDFCTMVVKRSGRSVLYNQAVKHMGEFFCFAHVTPAVLGVAAAERRASNGSALAVVRDALGALFGLLAKGSQLNESSRAAVRESLRCAACSAAPASVLVESAVECMLRSVKQRDDFALRAREMGLTVVYMCLRRHPWSAVRAYFDGPCRVTNLRSKLHALVSVLAMARADASKSALNKHLVGEVLLVLHAHVGERLAGVVRMAELDADTVDELLRGAGMRAEDARGAHSGSRRGAESPARRPRTSSSATGAAAAARKAVASPAKRPPLRAFGARAEGAQSPGGPGRQFTGALLYTIRAPDFVPASDAREPTHQLDPAAVSALEGLPACADEAEGAHAHAHAHSLGERRHSMEAPMLLRDAGALNLHRTFDGSAASLELCADLDDEIGAVLQLVKHCYSAWPHGQEAVRIDPALVHNCLVRIRRCHRLCDDELARGGRAEPSPSRLRAFRTMVAFAGRILHLAMSPKLLQHALTHIAEYLCYRHATPHLLRAPPDDSSPGLDAKAGWTNLSLLDALYYLLAEDEPVVAASVRPGVREALRCACCSELLPHTVLDSALRAMRSEHGAAVDEAGLALPKLPIAEMGLCSVYMCFLRHPWDGGLSATLQQRAPGDERTYLQDLLRAVAASREHAAASALVGFLRTQLVVELSSRLGEGGLRFVLDGELGLSPEQRAELVSLLYSCGTPNGHKVTILLEELGLAYDAHFISIMAGDQFGSEFTARCPNSKIPMLVDQAHATTAAEKAGGHSIFESGAIMLHLAEKTGSGLLPADPAQRSECLQWLFFQVGAGPFFGQFGHFHKYAPGAAQGRRIVYAHERYTMEVQRLCDVLERALADERPFLLGQQLTLADLAWFPWVRCLSTFYAARAELELEARFPRLMAWEKRLGERPAFVRGMRVNAFDATPEYKNYSTAGS